MSTLSDITELMGSLMLKGWVLTDKGCPTRGCAVPLMRSPKGQTPEVYLCCKCNGNTSSPNDEQVSQTASSATNKSMDSAPSRSSTPLTEMSADDEDEEFILPPETEESRRRREQSDRASTAIGARLLKGWAMLGEECPNETCYGVPLVRPPSTKGGEKDPRKECVICGNVYLPEGASLPTSEPAGSSSDSLPSGSTAISGQRQAPQEQPPARRAPAPAAPTFVPTPSPPQQTAVHHQYQKVQPTSSAFSTLNATDHALQTSLNALSARMLSLSNSVPLDITGLGNTADAIAKVAQALGQVKSMQWSEAQAQSL